MLNNIKIKNYSTGFTLLEVLTAVFVITIGVGGAITLINQTIGYTQTTSYKLTASYLAQEGIEIIKNIRDSNFLKIYKTGSGNWTDGLENCNPSDNKFCEADYENDALASYDTSFAGNFLNIDSGFYKYSGTGIITKFKRKITIAPSGDILEVLIEVSWQEKGRSYEVVVQENLHNWW